MKSYLKFLSRNKLYTAIEAVGLIVSLAFVLIIGISVHDQLSIRNFVPAGKNLYLIGNNGNGTEYRNIGALASFPEVKSIAAFSRRRLTIDLGDGKIYAHFLIVSPEILDYFPVETKEGNIDQFKGGNGVLITESAARRLFPDNNPLENSVTVANINYQGVEEGIVSEPIVAVINPSVYSPFEDYDFVVTFASEIPSVVEIRESNVENKGFAYMVSIFADMIPDFDMAAFSSRFVDTEHTIIPSSVSKDDPMAIPYRDIFYSPLSLYNLRQGKFLYLEVLIILGLILLVSAILNYINLSMAISGNRVKEMATRRLVGASRGSIIWKSIAESLFFVSVSFITAVLLAQALIPILNDLRPDGFTLPFRLSADGTFLGIGISLILITGVLAGLSPALFISSYRPLDIVTGQVRRKRKMGFNRVCIVMQTILSLVLIAVSIALNAQLHFMEKIDLGFSPQKDLYYFYPNIMEINEGLEDLLATFPKVKAIGHTTGFPSHPWAISTLSQSDYIYSIITCDSTAFSMMGFRILEKYTEPRAATLWITEEGKNTMGISQENHDDITLVGTGIEALGGVMENYRRFPVNGKDPYESMNINLPFISAVQIVKRTNGFLIQTLGDHADFEREFKNLVKNYYKETKGITDIFSDTGVTSGYLEDIIASDYDDLRHYVHLVELFTLVAIILSILGLVAMSTWFASSNAKDIAIRKVFGGTIGTEIGRTIRTYMVMILIAAVIGVPLAIYATGYFLENYPERISNYSWVFIVSTILMLAIAFFSVLWQTLKAARTNPAEALKKE